MTATLTPLSSKAQARLRRPRTRGLFRPLDAARRQLGLLTVADGLGQARISWLVGMESRVIEDSRFLAFGRLESHPAADVFTETVRGRTLDDACAVTIEQLDALLRDDPLTPAFADAAAWAFIPDLQSRALAAWPGVTLLPKPAETVAYQRKREQDWTDLDRTWFTTSYLKRIARVDQVAAKLLGERRPGATHVIDGLHDDFRLVVRLAGVADDEAPTLLQLLGDELRRIHPDIRVEAP